MDLKSGHEHSRCAGLQPWEPLCHGQLLGRVVRTGMAEIFLILLLKIIYLCIYLFVLGLNCSMWEFFFSCGMRDLVP